jgi:hypothetical protein
MGGVFLVNIMEEIPVPLGKFALEGAVQMSPGFGAKPFHASIDDQTIK